MALVESESDLEGVYGSQMMSATELGDKKLRVKIKAVHKEMLQGRNPGETARPRLVLDLTGTEKRLVLNATNYNVVRDALGRNPQNWIDAELGIKAENTTFAGRSVRGLRVKVLSKASSEAEEAAALSDDPNDEIPF